MGDARAAGPGRCTVACSGTSSSPWPPPSPPSPSRRSPVRRSPRRPCRSPSTPTSSPSAAWSMPRRSSPGRSDGRSKILAAPLVSSADRTVVASGTVGADGTFSALLRPTRRTLYVASFPGDGEYQSAKSPAQQVDPQGRIGILGLAGAHRRRLAALRLPAGLRSAPQRLPRGHGRARAARARRAARGHGPGVPARPHVAHDLAGRARDRCDGARQPAGPLHDGGARRPPLPRAGALERLRPRARRRLGVGARAHHPRLSPGQGRCPALSAPRLDAHAGVPPAPPPGAAARGHRLPARRRRRAPPPPRARPRRRTATASGRCRRGSSGR